MAHARPYRFGLGPELALEELRKNAGIGYNAQVVDILERLVNEQFDFERYDRAYVNQLLEQTIDAQVKDFARALNK